MLSAMEPASLSADTTPSRTLDGGYTLDLGRAWDFLLPSGGVVMTAALRSAALAIGDDDYRLLSATAIFCEPIAPGPLTITPHILRRGHGAIQTRTQLGALGSAGCEVSATFARDRTGPEVHALRRPDVPPPEQCPDENAVGSSLSRARFFGNLEVRLAAGTALWDAGFAAGPGRHARWFRYRVPQTRGSLFDRLALPPIADTMPAALAQAIGPVDYRFYAPSVDLTVHVVDDTDRDWLLVVATLSRAHRGWATGRAEIWDDRGRFLACATQTMYLRTVSGTPPVVDASDRS
jgi:acyl-CoA thioesterase